MRTQQTAIDLISDCTWGDIAFILSAVATRLNSVEKCPPPFKLTDQEDIEGLSGVQAAKAIRRFYSGGVLQFVEDNDLTGWGE